jgi:hypothetical protein
MPDIEGSVSHMEIVSREVPKNEILGVTTVTNCELIFGRKFMEHFLILTLVVDGSNLP